MAKELTLKQHNFIQEYISNGGNGVKAALKAYDTSDYKTADAISRENLEKPRIQSFLSKTLNNKNLTKEDIIEKLIEHMQSENPAQSLKACELLLKYQDGNDSNEDVSDRLRAFLAD